MGRVMGCDTGGGDRSAEGFIPGRHENGNGDSMNPVRMPMVPRGKSDALIRRQTIGYTAFGARHLPDVALCVRSSTGRFHDLLFCIRGWKKGYSRRGHRAPGEKGLSAASWDVGVRDVVTRKID